MWLSLPLCGHHGARSMKQDHRHSNDGWTVFPNCCFPPSSSESPFVVSKPHGQWMHHFGDNFPLTLHLLPDVMPIFSPPDRLSLGWRTSRNGVWVSLLSGMFPANTFGWEALQGAINVPSLWNYFSHRENDVLSTFKSSDTTSCYNLPVNTTFPETKIRRTILGLIIL